MSDFLKKRTTVTSRIEKVKALEPPTMTFCLEPPFKPSAFLPYKLKTAKEIFFYDFPNETLGQRFDKVSYKMGIDFTIMYSLSELNGGSDEGLLHEQNPSFDVIPIQTFYIGTCYKVQPRFYITSMPFELYLYLNVNSTVDEIDKPSKLIIYLSSNNTWQSIVTSDWPRTTVSKLELEIGSSSYYLAEHSEQLFNQGIENSEECFKTHIESSSCNKCQFASVADLPMCNTSQEAQCGIQVGIEHNLWTKCNIKK